MNYTDLLIESDNAGLIVREKPLIGYRGRIYKNRIAINQTLKTDNEKACVLAEELGHHYTTVGNILLQDSVSDVKQELRARMWAYNKQIGLLGIIKSFEHGCQNHYEMAEFLNVTEEFLNEALERYRQKYGMINKKKHRNIFYILIK